MQRTRFSILAGIIFAAAAARLVPHAPNFTPIGALALFAGAHFTDKRFAFAVPFAAMLLSDVALGFHASMFAVYGCFSLIVALGLALRAHRTWLPIAGATLAGSVLFFMVTNFAVWAMGTLYPKTLAGLAACYAAAIPYFRNTIAGDAFFVTLLFGGFALAQKRWPALAETAPASMAA